MKIPAQRKIKNYFSSLTSHFSFSAGFTLIELLVVIGVLSILLAITLVAINPARQFQQARDTQRASDVKAILDAVGQYSIDQDGQLPGDGTGLGGTDLITTIDREISSDEANICALLRPLYIAALPTDPSSIHEGNPLSPCPPTYNTEYMIRRTSDDRVVVTAPNTELNPSDPIEVTR